MWSVLFGAVMLGAALLFVIAPLVPDRHWWLPKNVSSFGGQVDGLFYLILAITGFFFILTEALLVYFMYRYAGGPGTREQVFGHHYAEKKVFWTSFFKSIFRPVTAVLHNQHRVELAWTLVPAVILLFIALVQIEAWANIKYQSRMPLPEEQVKFKLVAPSFVALRGSGVPEGVVSRLESMKDETFNDEEPFLKRAAQVLSPDDVQRYRGRLLEVGDSQPQQVEVSARQFEWRIRYPSASRMNDWQKKPAAQGYESATRFAADRQADDLHLVNELHVWKYKPVLVQLKTQDVIHSFYLPNLRLKQDALPGKTIPVWFMATESNTVRKGDRWEDGLGRDPKTGEVKDRDFAWDLLCAELCGWGHYKMQGRLYVHPDKDDYLAWLAQALREQNLHNPPK
jgi:cytochrome c oxidase subunit 2